MTFHSLMQDIEDYAKDKGFWKDGRSFGDDIALMHSELSEALEEFRKGHALNQEVVNSDLAISMGNGIRVPKPEGIPSEFADLIIRVLHLCAEEKIDIERAIMDKMHFNRLREFRHGNKRM